MFGINLFRYIGIFIVQIIVVAIFVQSKSLNAQETSSSKGPSLLYQGRYFYDLVDYTSDATLHVYDNGYFDLQMNTSSLNSCDGGQVGSFQGKIDKKNISLLLSEIKKAAKSCKELSTCIDSNKKLTKKGVWRIQTFGKSFGTYYIMEDQTSFALALFMEFIITKHKKDIIAGVQMKQVQNKIKLKRYGHKGFDNHVYLKNLVIYGKKGIVMPSKKINFPDKIHLPKGVEVDLSKIFSGFKLTNGDVIHLKLQNKTDTLYPCIRYTKATRPKKKLNI